MHSIFAAKKPIEIEVMEVSGKRAMTRSKLYRRLTTPNVPSTFRAEDEAVVLVLGNVNTHANHDEYLRCVCLMLGPQDALLL